MQGSVLWKTIPLPMVASHYLSQQLLKIIIKYQQAITISDCVLYGAPGPKKLTLIILERKEKL